MKRIIDVVGAVVVRDGLVMCVQRGPAGNLANLWEFPGGKIEPGETAEQALEREILEELVCRVVVGNKVTTTSHEYDFAIINLTTFYCELVEGAPHLVEHADLAWLEPDMLHELDWAPADVPSVDLIRTQLTDPTPLR